jgi:hypothetical protein
MLVRLELPLVPFHLLLPLISLTLHLLADHY